MFEHLTTLETGAELTAEFVLRRIRGAPVLIVKQANEANPAYFSDVLRANEERRRPSGSKALTAFRRETREIERRLLADHVLVGWRGVVDSTGVEVPFSRDAGTEFLTVLPWDMFDELNGFATNPDNFRRNALDAEALAKNS